ncbi:MAG: hypothetical protein Phog2KO_33990 [Phototrophicaceae bacterium]
MAKNLNSNSRSAWMLVALTVMMSAGVVALLQFGSSTAESHILFTQFDGTDYEIYVMDADGNIEQLTDNTTDDWGAGWSPDYSQIAFRSMQNGYSRIYVMNADGSHIEAITPDTLHTGFYGQSGIPSWSADGSQIAFEATDYTRDIYSDIYVVNVNSGDIDQVTDDNHNNMHPDFSPHGSQIAYASDNFGEECFYTCDIFVINRDGTNERQLTDTYSMDVFPQFSPDGSQIAFHSERTGNSDIYVMNANGTNERNLTNSPSLDRSARWSADGDSLLFRSERDGDSDIYIMNLDDGLTIPATNNDQLDIYPDW